MDRKRPSILRRIERILGYVLICLVPLLVLFILVTHINYTGRREGIYLLKGENGSWLELKDDLYLNDGFRVILSIDLQDPNFQLHPFLRRRKPGDAFLYYEWDKKDGSGFVRNILPGGRQILTCFGRFVDDSGKLVHGLFVGGGLPPNVRGDKVEKMDETGMAYFDGKRWYHVWCTANEVIDSASVRKQTYPSDWKYLGSSILHATDNEFILKSSHEATINGQPFRMDRYASFKAGEPYFILSVRITNIGRKETSIYYTYGDEPWVGDYGSSKGNVGWTKDMLINYTYWLDTKKYSYAGFFDYGNDAIGEGHDFTMTADFIEWFGDNRPQVYFSNSANDYPAMDERVPLSSNTRFMCLQWGPDVFKPGRTVEHLMAIGMAGNDSNTGFPVIPDVKLEGIQ